MDVRFTAKASALLNRVQIQHPELHLLLDDTGCCGPSNVFLQDRPPAPVYIALDRIDGVAIYIHPAFAGGRTQNFTVDAILSEADDSFSLETTLGHRLTLGFGTTESGLRESSA